MYLCFLKKCISLNPIFREEHMTQSKVVNSIWSGETTCPFPSEPYNFSPLSCSRTKPSPKCEHLVIQDVSPCLHKFMEKVMTTKKYVKIKPVIN